MIAAVSGAMGALATWWMVAGSAKDGQTFGSPLVAALRDFAPLIQGLTTFLGAALGGVVAMVTTRLVLAGADSREREKMRADAALKRGEILRGKAEELLLGIREAIEEANEFGLSIPTLARTKANGGDTPELPNRSVRNLVESMVLLSFYFPQHVKLGEEFLASHSKLYLWQNEQMRVAAIDGLGWMRSADAVYIPQYRELQRGMDKSLATLTSALQADVHRSLPG